MSMVSEQDQAMARLMHSCWVAFAKAGRPECATGPAWPPYSAATDQLMEFGDQSGVVTGFRKTQLDAQETFSLPSLKLPN